ncbi:MAG TPA: hypothetical protein PLU67_03815, partial [Candidatus Kapabacteria bacterium]|nr:hypothetical protein [Candidatus Kapabacteria bacterium]
VDGIATTTLTNANTYTDNAITALNLGTMSQADVNDYYTKSEVYNKTEVDNLLSNTLSSITTDATLTGDGTTANPLGINLNNENL